MNRHSNIQKLPLPSAFICVNLWLILFSQRAQAAWPEPAWPYRRLIDVTWDADHASGNELATADFYSDGHTLPDASDIRITTEEGKPIPHHILTIGSGGDRIRLIFSLQKGIKKYAVYFGNPKPPPPSDNLPELKFQAGLLIETRTLNGNRGTNFQSVEESWQRSTTILGQAMIPSPFLGYNLFGDQDHYISKITGSLFTPIDGDYNFAVSVDDEAALYVDGQPLLFATIGPSDIRYHASIFLGRGSHDFQLYHQNDPGDGRFAVAWKRPDMAQFEIIGRQSFGTCFGSQVGALEEREKPLVADFFVTQASECFVKDGYSFRYHFISNAKTASAAKYDWDFGDGQIASQPELDHVYLADGLYPVRLTVHVGANTQSQTARIVVGRNYENLPNAVEDQPKVLSKIVEGYDLNTLPPSALTRAILLHLQSNRLDAALTTANRLAQQQSTPDANAAFDCLEAVDHELQNTGRADLAVAVWDRVPQNSDLQPRAAARVAQLALWHTVDFKKAVDALTPFRSRPDPSIQRLYAEALILSNEPESGKKILLELPAQAPDNRQAVLGGASARSVEAFILTNETEAAEEAWERWQTRYPADFLGGYSVLLRTKIIEQRKSPMAAAKVAQAFALAMPQSSYAPQLIDRASKLLAVTDPKQSQALHELLKQKYPEDPLSQ